MFIEEGPTECRIRSIDLQQPGKRGPLLVTFIGPQSLHQAKLWILRSAQ